MKKLTVAIVLICLATGAYAQSQAVRAFSHRGGRLERDENTLLAFQQSWDAGYTGFETDIRMTRDGVLYLTHDHTLERTTDGSGVFEQKTAAEIERLRTRKGNKILSLEDFCRFLDGKDSLYAVQTIRPSGSQLIFTSSDYRGLRYLQQQHPEADLLLIVSKPINDETIALAKTVGIKALGCKLEGTSRAMVQKAHAQGLIVSLWPNHTVEDFLLGVYLGADRLCCDIPLTLKQFLDEKMPWLNVTY